MKRTFAIGDIHGCLKTLDALLDKIAFTRNDEIIFLGDYVDRGPNSKGVLDKLAMMMINGYSIEMLCGNHELIVLSDFNEEDAFGKMGLGDANMLASFGVPNTHDIPVEYFDFLKTLPYYKLLDNYILVHAGLDFKEKDPLSNPDEMMWIRRWYNDINYEWLGNRIIVHGHTPQTKMETVRQLKNLTKVPALDIDCGAFMRSKIYKGYGYLCAFDLTNQTLHFQENVDENCMY